MTEYLNKSFSVLPGKDGGQKYRDNWDRIFKKPEPSIETNPPMHDEAYDPKNQKPEPQEEPEPCSKCGPQEAHTCPYNEEINNDHYSMCNCCPCAEQNCLDDI